MFDEYDCGFVHQSRSLLIADGKKKKSSTIPSLSHFPLGT